MRGKWILFAGLSLLLAVAAGVLAVYRLGPLRKPRAPAPVKPAAAEVHDVSVAGQIQAQRVVDVPVPVDGTVESFGAEAGEDVFEGQLIAHIRSGKLEAEVEGAQLEFERVEARVRELEAALVAARLEMSRGGADASRARSDFDRAAKLYQRQQMLMREGATPRLAFEKAEREYRDAKDDCDTRDTLARQAADRVDALKRDLDAAQKTLDERRQGVEQARADVALGDVRAPVAGIVIARGVGPGEEVNREMGALFRIAVTLSALEISVQPAPAAVARIQVGQPVAIHVAEAPDEITGTVREIKDSRVIVEFTSPTPAIRPGATAQVRIKLS
jgi:multidrug resistance efflux pump